MSTDQESPESELETLPELFDAFSRPSSEDDLRGTVEILSDNVARLEDDLQAEKDNRNEERFYWLLGCFLLGNIVIYSAIEDFAPFVLLFISQVVVLFNLAKKFGHEWAVQALGATIEWFGKLTKRSD